jgi:hypothetical protein
MLEGKLCRLWVVSFQSFFFITEQHSRALLQPDASCLGELLTARL